MVIRGLLSNNSPLADHQLVGFLQEIIHLNHRPHLQRPLNRNNFCLKLYFVRAWCMKTMSVYDEIIICVRNKYNLELIYKHFSLLLLTFVLNFCTLITFACSDNHIMDRYHLVRNDTAVKCVQ